MASFSKIVLTGSTDGRGVLISGTTSGGANTVHTASATATDYDEVWLYAMNTDTTARKLTVEWGSNSSPGDLIEITIPAESGLTLVSPGLVLKGNASALTVKAFAATTDVVTIHGYVNRIS
jgi:hypothetical protein